LFCRFLDLLPPDVTLVLNGDTFENPAVPLPETHARVLERIRREATDRNVVLIPGNHDADLSPIDLTGVPVASQFQLENHLLAVHGHELDLIMPAHRRFIRWFRIFHWLRVKLGARNEHVAQYAKRWRRLYNVLVASQRNSAIKMAKREHVDAIACGHVHFVEDTHVDGIRYLNTGAWTEPPVCCVAGDRNSIYLCRVEPIVEHAGWPEFPRPPAGAEH
jgi:UDP-2,3-diacylglucosamine pyrophosphatase LpxH